MSCIKILKHVHGNTNTCKFKMSLTFRILRYEFLFEFELQSCSSINEPNHEYDDLEAFPFETNYSLPHPIALSLSFRSDVLKEKRSIDVTLANFGCCREQSYTYSSCEQTALFFLHCP